MAHAADWNMDDPLAPPEPGPPPAEPPLVAYQAALKRYEAARLFAIYSGLGIPDLGARPSALPSAIAENLREPRIVERLFSGLDNGSRMALGLFAVTETTSWPLSGLSHALACLGVEPGPAVRALVGRGLLVLWLGAGGGPVYDIDRLLSGAEPAKVILLAHPSILTAARTVLPEVEGLPRSRRRR